MKGLILGYKENGVLIVDKNRYFHFVPGFTDCPLGTEIEIPEEHETEKGSSLSRLTVFRVMSFSFGTLCACLLCVLTFEHKGTGSLC